MLIDIQFYDKPQNPNIRVENTWKGGLSLSMDHPTEGVIWLDVAEPAGETGVYWATSGLENFLEEYSDYRVVHDYDRKFPTLREHLQYLREWGQGFGVADDLEQIKTVISHF